MTDRLAYAVLATALTVTAVGAPGLMTVDTPTVHYAAIVRADTPGTWRVIEDANHAGTMSNPRCEGTMLRLDFPQAGRILGATAQADESFVALDIAAGVSVGVDRVLVRFARDGVVIACGDPVLVGPSKNFWLSVDLEEGVVP